MGGTRWAITKPSCVAPACWCWTSVPALRAYTTAANGGVICAGGIMQKSDSIEIVQALISSICESPDQFQINIKVVGQSIVSNGGIGQVVTATGGGAGSTTIGQKVSVPGGDVTLANQKASRALDEQFRALVESLEEIKCQLSSDNTDVGLVEGIYNSLKNTWVPGLVISVLGTALSSSIGIGI